MHIKLNKINNNLIVDRLLSNEGINSPLAIQYADFNVCNYLYEEKLDVNVYDDLLFYPDSTAVYIYLKYLLKLNLKKIVSTDLQNNLLVELNKYELKVFLLGDSDSILFNVKEIIDTKYPNIKLIGLQNGYNYNSEKVVSEINKNNNDILFVGLGVGRQERWILENCKKINVKIIMSVGGWFQYLANVKKRAPKILRKMHLEWIHKLLLEFPRVWKRYFFGIPLFYFRLFTKKIKIQIEE